MKKEDEKKAHVNERQLVVFNLSGEEFGIEITKVNSIIKMEKITKIPNSDFFVEGVINLRGKIIVVLNLHKKLRLAEKEWNKDTRIIVIDLAEETIGMVVDEVKEVLRIEDARIEAAPEIILEKIDSDYIEGVGILNERLIVLLDVEKVLHKHELENIKHVSDAASAGVKVEEKKDDQKEKKNDASPESYFWFNNGRAVKNITELVEDLERLDEATFKHHVNSEKNDFSNWIKDVMKDEALAKKISGKTDKEEIIAIIKG